MFQRILTFSIEQRWMIMLACLALFVLGIHNMSRLSIDAVPDITNVQIQINTAAPGFSPLETERLVTFPIELAMLGAPRLVETRSISKYGLSQVTVIFEENTDIYFARQQVTERIQQVSGELPEGLEPHMGPVATGLGEIFLWTLEAEPGIRKKNGEPYTSTDFRTLQDWVIKPQLLTLPGITEINSIGGYKKQFHVTPDPQKLIAYGLSFRDVLRALGENNSMAGAGYIEHHGEQYLIRVPGLVYTLKEIKAIPVGTDQGVPILVGDVADVLLGKELRTGAATKDGKEAVMGTAFMLVGANSSTVAGAVGKKLEEANRSLPKGIQAIPFYDRTELVDRTIRTVKNNLLEGAALVIAVLFFMLGNFRAALITAAVIPLSMLFAVSGMVTGGVSANLMSLGAIDFGIIVDGAVVMVENCVRHLGKAQKARDRTLTLNERLKIVFESSREVQRAILFGQTIIVAVYLPIFAFAGVEGKMFHPMAQTVVMALLGAILLSITFVPAACAIFLNKPISDKENAFMRRSQKIYRVSLDRALNNPFPVIVAALIIILFTGLLASQLGTEFVPSLDEGDIALQSMSAPGTGLAQSVAMQQKLELALEEFPEVKTVATRIGTAEVATDVMGPNTTDTYVMLNSRADWPDPSRSKEDLVAAMNSRLAHLPGSEYEFSQPIELRCNELLSGVRADVAIKVFGDDLTVLQETAQQIADIVRTVDGASDVRVEQVAGLPVLTVDIKRQELARYGLDIADVQQLIQIAMGGKSTGKIYQGDRRFDLVVRLPESYRVNLEAVNQLPILLPSSNPNAASYIPLSTVADIQTTPSPNQISRENSKRRIAVTFNVRGRDMGSVVADSQLQLEEKLKLPSGYWIDWGGQFKLMNEASKRLAIVIPFALTLIFLALYSSFGNIKDGLLVFTGVPFALTGGVLSLWLRDIPLSISAVVGFIALSGVAVLNGLVLLSFIRKLRFEGLPLNEAIRKGATIRLRPVLMTALVAALGFIPMALATSAGAEVQRPLATVVIGGIISSTVLTLLVLPVLYQLFAFLDPPLRDKPRNITVERGGSLFEDGI